ncbi:MAG: histidine phosphatase family protein [Clostridiales bacterium]|nr:histidine phosphatase family protein [Clostridiales bacterium]
MTTVYFVRHAQPNCDNHDDATRELSEKGLKDRKLVSDFLMDKDIGLVFSSPYKRAVDTVSDFAERNNLPVITLDAFRERKVADGWLEDFQSFCQRQWENFHYKLFDGECLEEVQRRNILALEHILTKYKGQNIVVGSHGTALSTIINHYDKSFGYADFARIKDVMPWIVAFTFEGKECIQIRQFDLLSSQM